MLFATVIYGCFLGWFRFFRISNLGLAINGFSADGRYPAFTGILYISLYVIALAFFLNFEGIQNLSKSNVGGDSQNIIFSLSKFSYFVASVVFGEVCRAINDIEDDSSVKEVEPENFMDLLKSLSPNYYVDGSLEHLIGDETCAAIDVSSWLYGIRSDVKRSLIIAVSKEYNVSRFYRSEVLDYFNSQTGTNQVAKRALRKFVKKHGKGSKEAVAFLEKIAKIGKRSGFAISDVTHGLASVGAQLGISEGVIQSILKRASNVSTDNDWRDFSDKSFWEKHERRQQSYSQKTHSQGTYSQQDYARSRSSRRTYSNPHSLSERQKFLRALGLTEGATEKDIRTAYRKLAMKYHPDRVQADGGTEKDLETATEKMSVVNTAYDWLCDNPA